MTRSFRDMSDLPYENGTGSGLMPARIGAAGRGSYSRDKSPTRRSVRFAD